MKLFFKIIGAIVGIIILALLYFMLIHKSDIRTDLVKNDVDPIQGRAMLMKMGAAHNITKWDSVSTYSVMFQDEFFGTMGQNSHPFPSHQQEMLLDYIPNTFDGRMSFDDGMTWGVQSWNTYIRQKSGQAVKKKDKNIEFWVPTYQYFIEFPLRIQSATVVSYAGEKNIDGKLCKGIFASWDKYKPQSDIDQYLIWVDAETHMIQQLEYTVRDLYGFLVGICDYKDYKDFDGIPLPTRMPVGSNMVDGKLHQMDINGVRFNIIPKSDLLPFEGIEEMGDEKL